MATWKFPDRCFGTKLLYLSFVIVINTSLVFSITVITRDHIISNTGDSVKLPCHTDAGHATVYWKRGPSFENSTLVVNVFKGAAYPRRPNVRMDVKNYSMWLDDVQVSDAGHYLCVVAPSPRLGLPKMSGTWLEVNEVMALSEDLTATMAMHNTSSRESFPMMVNTTMAPNTTRRSTKAPTTTRKAEMSSSTKRTSTKAPTTTWKGTITSSTTRTATNATTTPRKATMTSSTTRTTAKATTTTREATIVYSTLQTTFEENEREDVVLKNFAILEKGEAFASTSGGNLIIISSIRTMSFAYFAMFFGLRFLCEEKLLG